MEHVETLRPLVSGDYVAHSVVADVPHVDATRGVREHLEDVIFRPGIGVAGAEGLVLFPDLLPFPFRFTRVVPLRLHPGHTFNGRHVARIARQ